MIVAGAYDPQGALIVFRDLDPYDLLEAQAIRGAGTSYAQLFAEWHGVQPAALLSLVLKQAGQPFAVLLLRHTGQAGVAEAALLARNHRRWRRGLALTAREIRAKMAEACAAEGVHRIEARSWAGHPRAGAFLRLCGFVHEAEMHGFGATGAEIFHQFAWTAKS